MLNARVGAGQAVMPLPEGKQFHVFFCHSSVDNEFIDKCMEYFRLKYQLKCCSYLEDFPLGEAIIQSMERCLRSSAVTLLMVNQNFLQSQFCQQESNMAHTAKMDIHQDVKVVTVRLDRSEIPLVMKTDRYVDISDDTGDVERAYDKIYLEIARLLQPVNDALEDGEINTAFEDTDQRIGQVRNNRPVAMWSTRSERHSRPLVLWNQYEFNLDRVMQVPLIQACLEIANKLDFMKSYKLSYRVVTCIDISIIIPLFLFLCLWVSFSQVMMYGQYQYIGYWIPGAVVVERAIAIARRMMSYIEENLAASSEREDWNTLTLTKILEREMESYCVELDRDLSQVYRWFPPKPARHPTGRRLECFCTFVENGRRHLRVPWMQGLLDRTRCCAAPQTYVGMEDNALGV